MAETKGECRRCGTCCKAIRIPVTHEHIQQHGQDAIAAGVLDGNDPEHQNCDSCFVFKNWEPITEEEALAINPYLDTWEREQQEERSFWRCKRLNPETNLCKIHDSLTRLCAGFPWYERPPMKFDPLYSPDCGFQIDKLDAPEAEGGILKEEGGSQQ